MRFSRRRRAFTLIELILVMLILALAAGLITPTLRVFGIGRSNNDTARQIVALAHYARTQAITEGRAYRLNIDANQRTLWLTADNGAGSFTNLSGDYGQVFASGSGTASLTCDIKPQTDGTYITFQPIGRVDPAHIDVTDSVGRVVHIACASATENFEVTP